MLKTLGPETSNDPQTVGIWGAVHKHLWETTSDARHLDEAVRSCERGFYLSKDQFNGITLALLLNFRASTTHRRMATLRGLLADSPLKYIKTDD